MRKEFFSEKEKQSVKELYSFLRKDLIMRHLTGVVIFIILIGLILYFEGVSFFYKLHWHYYVGMLLIVSLISCMIIKNNIVVVERIKLYRKDIEENKKETFEGSVIRITPYKDKYRFAYQKKAVKVCIETEGKEIDLIWNTLPYPKIGNRIFCSRSLYGNVLFEVKIV